MATYLNTRSSLAYIEQNSAVDGSALVKSFMATVTSATGSNTTTTATISTEPTTNTLQGYKAVCIGPSTSAICGQESWVKSNSTSALTFYPAFEAVIPINSQFAFFQNTGYPIVVASSAGSTTKIYDSSRLDTVSQYVGAYAVAVKCSNITSGVSRLISASTALGSITVAAFPAAVGNRDILEIWRPIEFEAPSVTLDLGKEARPMQINSLDQWPDVVAGRGGSISIEFEAKPLVTKAGDNTAATRNNFGRMMQTALGAEYLATGSDVGAGTTTANTTWTTNGTYANTLGNAYCVQDAMRWIAVADAGGAIYTMNAAARTTYTDTEVFSGTANYSLDVTSSSTKRGQVSFYYNINGYAHRMYNCAASQVQFIYKSGMRPKIKVTFSIDWWTKHLETNWIDSVTHYDTTPPIPVFMGDVYVDGTYVKASEATATIDFALSPIVNQESPTGRGGWIVGGTTKTCAITYQVEDGSGQNLNLSGDTAECFVANCKNGQGTGFRFLGQSSQQARTDLGGIEYQTVTLKMVLNPTTGIPTFVYSQA